MKNLKILILILFTSILLSCENGEGDPVNNQNTGQGGSYAAFTIVGDYLYGVDNSNLKVFLISEASKPVLVNNVPVGFNIETLFNYKNYLFIGSNLGMYIYDLETPDSPTQLSSVQHFRRSCDPVVANDSLAFVTLHANASCGNSGVNQLDIYNIKEPEKPILLSTRGLASPKGLGLYKNYVIICDGDEIKVFDYNYPNGETQFVTSISKIGFDVIVNGNKLIVVGDEILDQYQIIETDTGLDFNLISNINFI